MKSIQNITSHFVGVVALLALTTLTGCFTGVEVTPKISDSEVRKQVGKPTPEQLFTQSAKAERPSLWRPGKQFVISDSKASIAFGPAMRGELLQRGDTIRFAGFSESVTLAGDTVTEIFFNSPYGTLNVREEVPMANVTGRDHLDVPFAIDLDLIDSFHKLLKGKTLWILTPSVYDINDEPAKGLKFDKVTVRNIVPGNDGFPLKMIFSNSAGQTRVVYMTPSSRSLTARTFENIFSLSDPRKRYSNITDENWNKIKRQEIALDMTREECRLALGSPADVEQIGTYGGLMERWTYDNGIYLIFTDGRLTQFRK